MSQNLIEDKEFDISNKKQRLERLQKDSKSIKRQFVSRKLHQWKSTIRSNFGNNKKGKFLIDRRAEEAIYKTITEHAKAHHRRHGEMETGYIDEATQHLQSTDMKRIANEILKKLNCHLIKSKETFGAFGKPRNKHSRQAKQH